MRSLLAAAALASTRRNALGAPTVRLPQEAPVLDHSLARALLMIVSKVHSEAKAGPCHPEDLSSKAS